MRHVSVMSFTASIGLMAMFAVDFIDMIFIAMLGNDALAAAVGYAGTILFFTNSINIGLSIAGGSLVARALGADKGQDAKEYATSVAVFGIITGILVPLFVLPLLPQILALLGATGVTASLATTYLWIIMPTMSFMSVAIISMAVLRAHGDAKRSMQSTLFGAVLNAILDPIFIFGFDWGLEGAAIASVCARVLMLFLAIRPVLKVYQGFAKPSFALVKRDFSAVSKIAGPAVLTNVATPVGMAFVTREMSKYGSEAVAGMAIIGRLVPVSFAVVFALSGAIGPIVGQNFGAGNMDRVRGTFQAGVIFIALYVLIATAVLFALREPIAGLFDAQGTTKALIFLFCGPLALTQFFNGIIFVANATFNNLGHPGKSAWINWGRNTLGTLPFVILGSMWFGATGVLMGQALGGVVFAAVAAYLVRSVMTDDAAIMETGAFQHHRRAHLLFSRRQW